MSLFNLPVTHKEKPVTHHPWERTVRDVFSNRIKYVHNSIDNPHYAVRKEKVPSKNRVKFTVIGNRATDEFIYCSNLVRGLHKYRWKLFDSPVIRGVTDVEWPHVWNELKLQHGGLAFCIRGQAAVLYDGQFLGGRAELADLVAHKYRYQLHLNYESERVAQLLSFVKSTARPCVYLHMSVDGEHIGTMIFMLYADIVPNTCANFARLCCARRGGYGGTPVHRVVAGAWAQAGGFGLRSEELPCENFVVPHDRRGVIAMANDGRDVDCSTQFFILLQPMPWMQHKYVAFGQLIHGDSVLRQIESVPTWYEAPTSEIIIQSAGVFNPDCQDIRINPTANEYIRGHVEDLLAIGELFVAILMEQVYLEIEFRRIQRLEPPSDEFGEEEQRKRDLRAQQRYIRRREEMQKQLEKAITDTMDSHRTSPGGSRRAPSREENHQFDVEEYTYEPEEPSYHHPVSSASSPPPRETPFYIPLTDVPYPGEVDSNYDLKKFVKGYYCLESDLLEKPTKMPKQKLPAYKSEELLPEQKDGFDSGDSDHEQLDSDEEYEIKKYIQNNLDRVSFAGGVVKSIAKTQQGMLDLFQYSRKSELVTDDQLRRVRLASISPNQRELDPRNKVRLAWTGVESPPARSDAHTHRRPTAFIHPAELLKLKLAEEDDDDDNDDDEKDKEEHKDIEENQSLSVKFSIQEDEMPHGRIQRRPTAFLPVGTFKFNFERLDGDDDNDHDDGQPDDDTPKVRLAPEEVEATKDPPAPAPPRPIAFARKSRDDEGDVVEQKVRPSILARLYRTSMFDDEEGGPTLKKYKPLSEMQRNNILLTHSPTHHIKYEETDDVPGKYIRPSLQMEDSYGQLHLQHGKRVVGKVSSDYVNTIEQLERRHVAEKSIRGVEYARTRPAMSVSEYQRRNLKYQGDQKRPSNPPSASKPSGHKPDKDTNKERGFGLRLPGDSPLYQSLTTINNGHKKRKF